MAYAGCFVLLSLWTNVSSTVSVNTSAYENDRRWLYVGSSIRTTKMDGYVFSSTPVFSNVFLRPRWARRRIFCPTCDSRLRLICISALVAANVYHPRQDLLCNCTIQMNNCQIAKLYYTSACCLLSRYFFLVFFLVRPGWLGPGVDLLVGHVIAVPA